MPPSFAFVTKVHFLCFSGCGLLQLPRREVGSNAGSFRYLYCHLVRIPITLCAHPGHVFVAPNFRKPHHILSQRPVFSAALPVLLPEISRLSETYYFV